MWLFLQNLNNNLLVTSIIFKLYYIYYQIPRQEDQEHLFPTISISHNISDYISISFQKYCRTLCHFYSEKKFNEFIGY